MHAPTVSRIGPRYGERCSGLDAQQAVVDRLHRDGIALVPFEELFAEDDAGGAG